MAKDATKETPLMQQYNTIKTKYPGALLLFRVGDFYETFGEDAIKAAGILGITLTRRANGAQLAQRKKLRRRPDGLPDAGARRL